MAILSQVAPEFHKDVTTTFDVVESYDSHYVVVEVYYSRMETDEELAERVRIAEAQEKAREESERATFERLKKKFT